MKVIQAAILSQTNKPLEVSNIQAMPLLKGQVYVKILYSGICGSQLMEISGDRGQDPWLPHLLGHEGSGIVVAIGEGVSKVKPGDEVILPAPYWVSYADISKVAGGVPVEIKTSIDTDFKITPDRSIRTLCHYRYRKRPKLVDDAKH